MNENVDDPSRDLKIENALAGQPSSGLKGVRKGFIWAYLTKGPMLLGLGVEDAL